MNSKLNETAGQVTLDDPIALTNADIDKMLAANREQDARSALILKRILTDAKR
jgi:hypothetical protein